MTIRTAGAGGRATSVFDRLRRLMLVVFTVGTAGSLGAAWFFANAAANEAYDQLLISAAVQIAETVNVESSHFVVAPPDAAFETLALSRNDRIFYAVHDPSGALLTGYPDLTTNSNARRGGAPVVGDARFAGASVRTVAIARYLSAPGIAGWCTILVAQTRDARYLLAGALMAKISSLILAVGGLGFFMSLVATRRALRPLIRIEEALAAREPNDVTPLEVDSPRETQALVDAINKVMARMEQRMSKLQKFVAVAAHQIRTPLAALGAQVEILETERTPAEHRARVDRIRNRVAELGRLTNQLLGHAMIVYRAEAVRHEAVDLTALARDTLTNGVPLSLEREVTLTFDAPAEPVIVIGDPVGLKEGLSNLIHNAVIHGAGSQLGLSVGSEGDSAWVAVFDDGPGIPHEQWELVQSPFTAARRDGRGAGLGLSIVKEVAEAHSGRMVFSRPADGGFLVTLRVARLAARP